MVAVMGGWVTVEGAPGQLEPSGVSLGVVPSEQQPKKEPHTCDALRDTLTATSDRK
jgi:hypothetical protein